MHVRKCHLGRAVHVAVRALHRAPVGNLVLTTAAASTLASGAMGALNGLGTKLRWDEGREVAVSSLGG